MINQDFITLGEFIVKEQNKFPEAKGALSRIFRNVELSAKIINRAVRKAGLIDILGDEGSSNIQGEDQQKLDVYANNVFIKAISNSGDVRAIMSEEDDEIIFIDDEESQGAKYVFCMDPLDGSKNIDVNVSIGSIFSLYRIDKDEKLIEDDCLLSGAHQIAAGYIIYGSSTMLVYTTGQGVNGFTLDDSLQEFCLSHSNIKIPETKAYYSVNEGHFHSFKKGLRDYISHVKEGDTNARYIGSLIADFHRNLLKGGLFIYPSTDENPNGKLRLMYECNPMAFIMEQAGGKSTLGNGVNIMDVVPSDPHVRVPFYSGNLEMIKEVESFLK